MNLHAVQGFHAQQTVRVRFVSAVEQLLRHWAHSRDSVARQSLGQKSRHADVVATRAGIFVCTGGWHVRHRRDQMSPAKRFGDRRRAITTHGCFAPAPSRYINRLPIRQYARPANKPQPAAVYPCGYSVYSMINSGSPYSTGVPFSTRISLITPDFSASISFISFMASMMHKVSPSLTLWPTSTKAGALGLGAR